MESQDVKACSKRSAALAGALVAVVLASILGYTEIDDAYISFRYAENMAQGQGLVYNLNEWVLGTTSPLWCVLLAFGKVAFGLSPGLFALLLSPVAVLATALLAARHLPPVSWITNFLLVTAIFTMPAIQASIFSGMETMTYIWVVVATLELLGGSSPILAALSTVIAVALRPDGMLLAGVAIGSWIKRPRRLAEYGVVFGILLTAYLFTLHYFYGDFLPHSVAAKRVLYATEWWKVLFMFFEGHAQYPEDAGLFCFAGAGLFAGALRVDLRPWTMWFFLYMCAMAASEVKPIFYWYFTPSWFVLLWAGISAGITWVLQERANTPLSKISKVAPFVFAAVILCFCSRMFQSNPQMEREKTYRSIISDLQEKIPDGQSMMLEEIGILGYGFKNAYIVDAAALVSPEVLPTLKRVRMERGQYGEVFVESGAMKELIEKFKPYWIVGPPGRLRGADYDSEEWFQSEYNLFKSYRASDGYEVRVYMVR